MSVLFLQSKLSHMQVENQYKNTISNLPLQALYLHCHLLIHMPSVHTHFKIQSSV